MAKIIDHTWIFISIACGVYSQMVIRWQVGVQGQFPDDIPGKLLMALRMLANGWVISSVICTFFAGIFWMIALTKFEVSYAYPFMALSYVVVFALAVIIFQESVDVKKIMGAVLVVAGVLVMVSSK